MPNTIRRVAPSIHDCQTLDFRTRFPAKASTRPTSRTATPMATAVPTLKPAPVLARLVVEAVVSDDRGPHGGGRLDRRCLVRRSPCGGEAPARSAGP